ncbi:MAG: hypothetical protein IRY83_05765 [Chloroflexi bacterium]|nr:hypothetical protein [Chloroflexota bacterium]
MMKPVSIMWTQGVELSEARLVITAVRDFLRLVYAIGHQAGLALPPTTIRPFGTWYIPSRPEGSPYWGTPWYVDNSFDPVRQQVIGARFLDLVREEPWQKSNPHWDVAVIDHDLIEQLPDHPGDPGDDFAFGVAIPELATVLSVYRLRGLVRSGQRERALRRLVLQQFGFVLGLPYRWRTRQIEEINGRRYCANHCVMQWFGTVEQLARAADRQPEGVPLCDECEHDVIQVMLTRGRGLN